MASIAPIRRLVFTLLAFFAVAAPAHASKTMEIGIQDDAVFVNQVGMTRDAAFLRAAEIGVTTIRANVLWSRVITGNQANVRTKPAKPTYDFTLFGALVDEAVKHDLKVELTITGPAPRWATADKVKAGTRNPSAKEFSLFVTEVVKHFKGRVTRYSIWNEPNWFTWLSPAKTAASQYRALYTGAYTAIKKTDPKAEVVFGELAPQARPGASYAPLRFMRDVLCVDANWKKRSGCGTVRADAVSLHPYDYRHAPNSKNVPADDVTIGTVSRLTNALTRFRKAKALTTSKGREPVVNLTEFAYFASGSLAFPRATRAKYLTQAFEIARKDPKVHELLYFGLLQDPERQWNTGLLLPNGQPDTSFTSLKAWVEKQESAGLLRPDGR